MTKSLQTSFFGFFFVGSTVLNICFALLVLRKTDEIQFSNYSLTYSAVILQSGLMSGVPIEVNRSLSNAGFSDPKGPARSSLQKFILPLTAFMAICVFLLSKHVMKLRFLDAIIVPAFIFPSFLQAIYVGKLQFKKRILDYALIGFFTNGTMIILALLKIQFLPEVNYWSWIFLAAATLATLLARRKARDTRFKPTDVLTLNLFKTSIFVFSTYWVLRLDIFTARMALGEFWGNRYITVSSLATTITGVLTLIGIFSIQSFSTSSLKRQKALTQKLTIYLVGLWALFILAAFLFGPFTSSNILKSNALANKSEYIPILLAAAPIGIAVPLAFSAIGIHRSSISKLFIYISIGLPICLITFANDLSGFCVVYGIFGMFALIFVFIKLTKQTTPTVAF